MVQGLLSANAFRATFMAPMRDVTSDPGEVIDIWDYVAAVPAGDLMSARRSRR